MSQEIPKFPKIVCLCGSTKFKKEFMAAQKDFTLKGYIVVTVGFFGHADNEPISPQQKYGLDVLHFRKIELSNLIYVVNPGGYLGDSTKREITYARSLEKPVRWLEEDQREAWDDGSSDKKD